MKIPELFSQQPGRHTFERSNQAGQGHERPDRELGLDPKVQFNGDAP